MGSKKMKNHTVPREIFLGSELILRALVWNIGSDSSGTWINSGNDVPIVLLHGIGDSADIWRPVIRLWPGLFARPCIAVDLPGHGPSQKLYPGSYRLEIISRLIGQALNYFGIHKAILIGHSFGARVLINIANDYVDPKSLILIDMGLYECQAAQKAVVNHMKDMSQGANSKQALIDRIACRMPLVDISYLQEFIEAQAIRDGEIWRVPTDFNSVELLNENNSKITIDNLKKIVAPITFIRGAYSAIVKRDDVAKIFSGFNSPYILREISKAGHAIMIEQPAALANMIYHGLV